MNRPAIPAEVSHSESPLDPAAARRTRRRLIENLLPITTSLMFHAAILLVGFATYQTFKNRSQPKTEPPAAMLETGQMPRPAHASLKIPMQKILDSQPLNDNPPIEPLPDLTAAPTPVSPGTFAAAPGDATEHALGPHSSSIASLPGSLPFTVPHGNGPAGSGIFSPPGGRSTNPQSVVYLCDASGSMLGVFGRLKSELKQSINTLQPGDRFNVIFFSDDKPLPAFSRLVFINADNRRRAFDFIDNAVATGGTVPLPAIRLALAEKPQLLWVLTDGFDQVSNYDEVIQAFRAGNAGHAAAIDCILLQSDEDPKLAEVLKTIARENGGTLKMISKGDFE